MLQTASVTDLTFSFLSSISPQEHLQHTEQQLQHAQHALAAQQQQAADEAAQAKASLHALQQQMLEQGEASLTHAAQAQRALMVSSKQSPLSASVC